MAMRMTDTNIWEEDWFIELPMEYKLFYMYIKDRCDHAGIWRPNITMFKRICGANHIIFLDNFLDTVNKNPDGTVKNRIIVLQNKNWMLTKFISYQYGNRFIPKLGPHKGLLKLLIKNKIPLENIPDFDWLALQELDNQQLYNLGVPKGYVTPLDIDIDKDIDKDNSIIKKKKNQNLKKSVPVEQSQSTLVENSPPSNSPQPGVKPVIQTGSSRKEEQWPTFESNIPAPSEILISGYIEKMKIVKGVILTQQQVLSLWIAFKSTLTGVKFYNSISEIHSHFSNWLGKQDFKIQQTQDNASGAVRQQPRIKV